MIGTARIIRGNALALPLADASVDLVVTSPPYFGLRSYTDDGQHYAGQLGSETTPTEFVDALLAATREMVRVLKPSGSIFVNLGDKYCHAGRTRPKGNAEVVPWRAQGGVIGARGGKGQNDTVMHIGPEDSGVPVKSLMGIPWRYALRCIDDLGLILRAEIIWAKPNGLPESVTDRVRRSHETWLHFTVQPRYFSAVDEIREGLSDNGPAVTMRRVRAERAAGARVIVYDGTEGRTDGARLEVGQPHPLGKLPGSVWTIPTQPLTVPPELGVDHFAAFPSEWPRRIIKAWAPLGVCTECRLGLPEWRSSEASAASNNGMARRVQARAGMRGLRDDGGSAGLRPSGQRDEAVSDLSEAGLATRTADGRDSEVRHPMRGLSHAEALGRRDQDAPEWLEEAALSVRGAVARSGDVPEALHEMEAARRSREGLSGLGVAFCACPVGTPTQPSVVLDPFGGTGTTALVAKALGRTGISVDMSADYSRLATWRTTDPGQMAAALEVERPEPVSPDQLDLFDEVLA